MMTINKVFISSSRFENEPLEKPIHNGPKNLFENSGSTKLDRSRGIEMYQGLLILDKCMYQAWCQATNFQLLTLVSLCNLHLFNTTT